MGEKRQLLHKSDQELRIIVQIGHSHVFVRNQLSDLFVTFFCPKMQEKGVFDNFITFLFSKCYL